jgi:hypothetical protein
MEEAMTDDELRTIEPLVLDLLKWLEPEPKPYAEVMDIWRTSCPRLPVWETAVDRDLVESTRCAETSLVGLTKRGRFLLQDAGRIA